MFIFPFKITTKHNYWSDATNDTQLPTVTSVYSVVVVLFVENEPYYVYSESKTFDIDQNHCHF